MNQRPDVLRLPTHLLGDLLDRCSIPALLIESTGRVRLANREAAALLSGIRLEQMAVEEILGLGWREIEPIAREGASDLVLNLPDHAGSQTCRRGVRVRLDVLPSSGGKSRAILAFLELPSGRSRLPLRGEQGPGEHPADPFAMIHGSDPQVLAAKERARRFARTTLPILLLAETGTGKDRLARAIHQHSQLRQGPLVAINCGGLSPHLLESELFGYGPGAFTGAKRAGQDGKIGAADGGTLFLDEVAEMPHPLQSLLLRFLEDRTFYRIGENKLRQSNVRLVCATCQDLPRLVAEGNFRRDLYYRIKGACIALPPLRERNDIGEMARVLLDEVVSDRGLDRAPALSEPAWEWIHHQEWLGNVRELKSAIHHALVLADDDICLEHFPVEPTVGGRAVIEPATARPPAPASAQSLAEAEEGAVSCALEAAGGNLSAAARTLGIARSTLYRLIDRHGLAED